MKLLIFTTLLLTIVVARPNHKLAQITTDTGYIVNGEDAAVGAWPWQVSIQRCSIGCSHNCGGIIVNANWVLTAAHCIQSPTLSSHRLVFGINRRSDESQAQIRVPSIVRPHPDWINNGGLGFPNDVGLLRFSQPLDFSSSRVSPATLVAANSGDFAGVECTMSGWGRLTGGGVLPDRLQQAKTKVLSTAQCQAQGIPQARFEYHICVNDDAGVTNACNGDSGGPLNCPVGPGGRMEIAGVTSFVISGCITSRPAGYARVSAYRQWIDSNMTPL